MSTTKRPVLKIVCMCRAGMVRSVAMKSILHRYLGHDTLACGFETNSPEALALLFDWADAIVILSVPFLDYVPVELLHKTHIFDVGDDVWGNPFAEELRVRLVELLNANPMFHFGRTLDPDKVVRDLRRYREKIEARKGDPTA
jgi:hypothetical protein